MTRIDSRVEVKGLADLRRELRRVNDQLPKELGNVNHKVAEYVIDRATGRASTALEHRAARTMSAARQQRAAIIRLGGAKNPEALGAEFGAGQNIARQTSRGSVRGWNQFRPWRGSGPDAGYWLFPTIRQDTPQIIEMYLKMIDELTRRAFPD